MACLTRSLSFPPIPCFLLKKSDGERLEKLATSSRPIDAEFKVMPDHYPRRTICRHMCQTCLLCCSGISILYGIVRCFNVKVGEEFFAAEKTASEQKVPCVCIDSDVNQICRRVRQVVIPTPKNLLRVVWSWLALPRCALLICFPRIDSVDTLGSLPLHAKSFPLKTWAAFIIAGFSASTVSTFVLNFLSGEAVNAAVHANVVGEKHSQDFQVMLLNLFMLYMAPCLYEAVLVSRDEAMYQGICARARSSEARCLVAVTGAAHTNGILQRCRERGLPLPLVSP